LSYAPLRRYPREVRCEERSKKNEPCGGKRGELEAGIEEQCVRVPEHHHQTGEPKRAQCEECASARARVHSEKRHKPCTHGSCRAAGHEYEKSDNETAHAEAQ